MNSEKPRRSLRPQALSLSFRPPLAATSLDIHRSLYYTHGIIYRAYAPNIRLHYADFAPDPGAFLCPPDGGIARARSHEGRGCQQRLGQPDSPPARGAVASRTNRERPHGLLPLAHGRSVREADESRRERLGPAPADRPAEGLGAKDHAVRKLRRRNRCRRKAISTFSS